MADTEDHALAQLASIFEDYEPTVLLKYLRRAEGNVERATNALLNRSQAKDENPPSKKLRTSTGSIHSWLNPVKKSSSAIEPRDIVSSSSLGAGDRIGSPSKATGSPKPLRNLNDVLCSPKVNPGAIKETKTPSLPPLILSSPVMVSDKLPCCTLIKDVLPKDLAVKVFLSLVDDSLGRRSEQHPAWERNRWWLNDRLVESPHTTTFFISQEDNGGGINYDECAQYWYAGRPLPANSHARYFTNEMEEARRVIEPVVNKLLAGNTEALARAQRTTPIERFPLEYEGDWRGNVAAANCYRGSKETVGFHADQLTYLGPYPTIASLSLGTTRLFRLRATASSNPPPDAPPPRTFSIPLPHNSLLVMHPPCQERYKHCVPPQPSIDVFRPHGKDGQAFTERINITFRFYRPDFQPRAVQEEGTFKGKEKEAKENLSEGISMGTPKCDCGVPTILRADQKGKAAAAHDDTTSANASTSTPQPLRFFWQCQAGAQNEGKGCKFFRFLDMEGEGRGPCLGTQA